MEGFTLVLLLSWLVLIGCFVAMYFMDEATKKAVERRSKAVAQQETARRR